MKDNNRPLVSVIMPAFNERPDMITASISSILQQTYKNIELIILDDSIKKETIDAIDAFNSDNRVRIHRSSERVGFIKSLNLGCLHLQYTSYPSTICHMV